MSSAFSPNQALKCLHIGKSPNVCNIAPSPYHVEGDLVFLKSCSIDLLSFLFSFTIRKDVFPAVAKSNFEILALPIGDDAFWKEIKEGASLEDSELKGINALHIGTLRNLEVDSFEVPNVQFRGFHRPGFGDQIWLPNRKTALFRESVSWTEKDWYVESDFYCLVDGFNISENTWRSVHIFCSLEFLPEDIQHKERLIKGIFMIDWFTRYGTSKDYGKNYINQELKETLDYLRKNNSANAELIEIIKTMYPLTEEKLDKLCRLLGLLPEEIKHVKQYWRIYADSNYELQGKMVHLHFRPSVLTMFDVQILSNNIKLSQPRWKLINCIPIQSKRTKKLEELMRKLGTCEMELDTQSLETILGKLQLVCQALNENNDVWEALAEQAREFQR